jgi:hypothetical protein
LNEADRAEYAQLVAQGMDAEALRKWRQRHYQYLDYGVVSRRVVTDAGVTKLRDAFTNAFEAETFNFHGVGTGNTAEAVGDTALVTEITTVLNPDSTRATGTQTTPASNQYRSSGVVLFDGTVGIQEHGLFSQAATGGGTLWDRSVFAVQNYVSGEQVTTQYTLTINSGG